MENMERVTELVIEVLKHCPFQGRDICSLLSTAKFINSAVKEACSGCADVYIYLDTDAAQQLRTFGLWLSDYGHLLRSIGIDCVTSQREGCELVKVAIEASLLLALRLASRSVQPFCLQSFSSGVFFNPSVLQDLPASSLTSLQLTPPELGADISALDDPCCARALASLTGLKELVLEGADEAQDLPVVYLTAISSLSQLTYLSLEGADPLSLSLVPASLAQLNVTLKAAPAEGSETQTPPPVLDLSHLSRLTSMTIMEALDAASSFPPSLSHIVTVASSGTLQSLKHLPNIGYLDVSSPPWLDDPTQPVFNVLTQLTTVSHLKLDLSSGASFPCFARVCAQCRNLSELRLTDYRPNTTADYVEVLMTPGLLDGLTGATALTSLELEGRYGLAELQRQSQQAALGMLCDKLAMMGSLLSLDVCGLGLGPSAVSLSRLTLLTELSLANCAIPDMVATAVGCSLKHLCKLNLMDNSSLTDGCMPALGQLTGLTFLSLDSSTNGGRTGVTGVGLIQLTGLRRLRHLGTSYRAISREVLPKELLLALPRLNAD
jgi:hypothetical protein